MDLKILNFWRKWIIPRIKEIEVDFVALIRVSPLFHAAKVGRQLIVEVCEVEVRHGPGRLFLVHQLSADVSYDFFLYFGHFDCYFSVQFFLVRKLMKKELL